MKDFEKKYKAVFKDIQLEKTEANEIESKILSTHNRKLNFKVKYAMLLIIVMFLVGTTIVYGKEIVDAFKGFFWDESVIKSSETGEDAKYRVHVGHFNDKIDIPNPSPFTKDDLNRNFTYAEIERALGIEILKSDKLNKDYFKAGLLEFHGDKLYRAGFGLENDPSESSSKGPVEELKFSFRLWTQYSTKEERDKYSKYIDEEVFIITEYHIDSLDVDAYILETEDPSTRPEWIIECNCIPTEARAFFAYRGILYDVYMTRINRDEFFEILDSFTLDL